MALEIYHIDNVMIVHLTGCHNDKGAIHEWRHIKAGGLQFS